MILQEPYNSWLIKNVGENIDAGTRFVVKVDAMTAAGPVPLSVDFDLTWFVLLHSKDDDKINLDVALELLKNPAYLEQFRATLRIHGAKRLIAEYLLFKPIILAGLKNFIDFTLLNVPIDFVSHTLLLKHGVESDTLEIENERLNIVNMVLDTGFSITSDVPPKSFGVAIHKVLMMQVGDPKFTLAIRMLRVGFHLYSENMANNIEVAAMLIDNRTNNDCLDMLKNSIDDIKALQYKVAGNDGNIADYYYWVKEDLKVVEFLHNTLNIDITP